VLGSLTRREREVLELVATGATNRQIGVALYISEKTASVHVSRILTKLGATSRHEAASMARRLG
jgi:DNA-binding NarL/FixJ family response regulator